MSNWGWPQWVMIVLMLFGLVGRICIEVANSQKDNIELLADAFRRKDNWKLNMALGTLMVLFEWFVLAKGGFWG